MVLLHFHTISSKFNNVLLDIIGICNNVELSVLRYNKISAMALANQFFLPLCPVYSNLSIIHYGNISTFKKTIRYNCIRKAEIYWNKLNECLCLHYSTLIVGLLFIIILGNCCISLENIICAYLLKSCQSVCASLP